MNELIIINEIISALKGLVHPNCPDHTPYQGVCGTCGLHMNYDVLPDPDDVIEKIKEIKASIEEDLIECDGCNEKIPSPDLYCRNCGNENF